MRLIWLACHVQFLGLQTRVQNLVGLYFGFRHLFKLKIMHKRKSGSASAMKGKIFEI